MLSIKNRLFASSAIFMAVTAWSAERAMAEVPAQFVNAQTGTTYTMLQSDCSKLVTFSNSSAVAVTLPQAGTAGKFFSGCFIDVENIGTGTVTITPTTSTINGASTLILTTNQGAHIDSDSTNYQTQFTGGLSSGIAACTASASTGCNGLRGVLTTSSLSTAPNVAATLTLTNSLVGTTSVVLCTLGAYSGTLNTNGVPTITQCTPGAGTIAVTIANVGTTNLSGTVAVQFAVLN